MRLRFPTAYADSVAVHGDPFVPLLLLPCMILGERLYIDAPVSPRLSRATGKIQEILRQWVRGAKPITMQAGDPTRMTNGTPAGVGAFFSGGVDSFYTLLKHREEITHLILVRGFDAGSRKTAVYERVRANIAELARNEGKQLLEVLIDVREFSEAIVDWDYYHGAVLAAIGLASGCILRRVLIPASFTYSQLFPWGTHPLLDGLWSNDATTFVHDGCEASRAEKVVHWVSRSEDALKTLRVCHKNRNNEYNCGRCEKCLRTMIALHAGGVLERCRTFTRPLSLPRVWALSFNKTYQIQMAEDNLRFVGAGTRFDRALRCALRAAIRRSRLMLALKGLIHTRSR